MYICTDTEVIILSKEFRSRVYTNRPDYADLDSPEKFQAIQDIIATRLRQHPKAICSYSGGRTVIS